MTPTDGNSVLQRSGEHRFPRTKFVRPAVPPGFVRRTRLLEQLEISPTTPVTVVRAFPGSGTSLAVADWIGSADDHVADPDSPPTKFAWVSCDEGDRDPRRLWPAIVSSIEQVVDRGAATSDGYEIATVVNDLLAATPSLVVVVDNAHRAGDAVAVLRPLLERLPPGTSVVFTTSTRLPIQLERLDAAGLLSEIGQSALEFTPDEISPILAGEGLTLDDDAVAALHSATEGWLAPITLVLSATDGQPIDERAKQLDVLASLDDLAPLPRVVHGFFASEIRRAGGAEVLDVLFCLADLGQFSVADCRAVLGAQGGDWVEKLESGGMFITETNDGESYRFHPLFQRYLGHEAIGRPRRAGIERHRNAARWFSSSGSMARAIRHYFAAGDVSEAIETMAAALLDGNALIDPASVAAWLDEVDESQVRSSRSARAFAVYALVLSHIGDTAGARRWLLAAEQAGTDDPDPIAPQLARLGIEVMEGRVAEAVECYEKLETTRRRMQEPPGVIETLAGVAGRTWAGDLVGARAIFERFIASSPPPARQALATSAYSGLLAVDGRLDAAASAAEAAILSAGEQGVAEHWAMTGAWYARAQVAYDQGRLDAAGHDVREWIERGTPLFPSLSLYLHVQLANVVLTAGRVVAAQKLATAAAKLALDRRSPLWDQLTVLDVRIALGSGELGRARWLVQHIGSPQQQALTGARVSLAAGDASTANELMSTLPIPESRRGRLAHLIMQARVARHLGDESWSDERLDRALDIAIPEMAVTAFFEDGPELWESLARRVRERSEDTFLAAAERSERVARAARRHADLPRASPSDRGSIAALRPRELQVLRLIGEQLTNREIAATMGISLNTLKTHIRKLYDRLGIKQRSDAVDRARQLLGAEPNASAPQDERQ